MTSPLATEVLPSVRAEFRRNAALVIGISAYARGVPPLQSAAADAERLATILKLQHGYGVTLLKDAQATGAAIRAALAELQRTIGPEDRVLIYYAGHGYTDDSSQHAGYLVPADGAINDERSWLAAAELMELTSQLACRHFLLILDCCFAGSLRLAGVRDTRTRDLIVMPKQLFRERYERFVQGRAWQVLTSSAGDQTASDVSFDQLARDAAHSPFAQALFAALAGQRSGLLRGDGVITATDLYCFLRDAVELPSLANGRQQTPQLWPLVQHDKGEFVFLAPGRNPFDLPSNPTFALENNPYLGLDRPYAAEQASLFFGRSRVLWQLAALVRAQPLSVLAGPSGSGKTSLAQAGLLPQLAAESPEYTFLPPLRPGATPLAALAGLELPPADPPTLANRVGAWLAANPERSLGIVLDQLEQLFAAECPAAERDNALGQIAEALTAHTQRLRVLAIVRADRLADLAASALEPHWPRPFDLANYAMADEQNALREAIAGPAGERVIFFESLDPAAGDGQAAAFDMVGEIADALSGQPGALPLLSLTMSEIYQRFAKRAPDDRTLALADYTAGPDDALGGVVGALLAHAERVFAGLAEPDQARAQKLLLRMVATGGENPAPARVHFSYGAQGARELDYPDALSPAMRAVLMRLAEARLVVLGADAGGPYAELAHGALVRRWPRLRGWLKDKADDLALRERLYPAAANWQAQRLQAHNRLQRLRLRGSLWQRDNPDMDRARVALRADDSWLNAVEVAFVSYSMVEQTRRERWRWVGLISTTVVFAVLAVVAIGFLIYNLDLQQRAVTRRLLAASNDPPAGAGADAPLLLAAEALVRSGRSNLISDTLQTEAEQNLRNQLGQPELVAPAATATGVTGVQLDAAGGRVLLLGDEQARLWSPAGEPDLVIPAPELETGALAPDGQRVLTIDANGVAKLWDAQARPVATLDYDEALVGGEFAAETPELVTFAADDTVQRWSAQGELLGTSEPIADSIDYLRLSHDGRRALLFADTGAAWLWDAGEQRAIRLSTPDTEALDERAANGTFSHDGRLAAIGWTDGRLEIWPADLPLGEVAAAQPAVSSEHLGWINSVAFRPDDLALVTTSADATTRIWRPDASPVTSLISGDAVTTNASFSPDGQLVLVASVDGTARVWDGSGYQRLIMRHSSSVQEARFSADGRFVITSTDDKRVSAWQAQPYFPGLIRVAATAIDHIELAPGRAELLTFAADEPVARIWNLDGANLATLTGHSAPLKSAAFSRDGQHILTLAQDETARLWDAQGRPIAELTTAADELSDARLSPDNQHVVTTDGDDARVWDLAGQPVAVLRGHTGWVNTVAFSPDGQRIVTGSDDGSARVWDLAGNQLAVLQGHAGFVTKAAFSPDGQWIATAATDRTVRIWDLAGNQLALLRHTNTIEAIVFSPSGRSLVALAEPNVPQLWDLADLATPRSIELRGHSGEVVAVSFRPDGQRVLTASNDRTAREWDLGGRVVRTLRWQAGALTGAIYGPAGADGQPTAIITAAEDGTARVFSLVRDELLAQAACRVRGALAPAILAELGAPGGDRQPDFDPSSYTCPRPAR